MLNATNLSSSSPGFADLASLPGLRDFGGIPSGIAEVGRGVEYGLEENSALPSRHLTRDRDLVAELRLLTNETKSLREENAGLREDMKSHRKENAGLRQEIKSLRDELAALRDQLKPPEAQPVEDDPPRDIAPGCEGHSRAWENQRGVNVTLYRAHQRNSRRHRQEGIARLLQ
jgi:regulator of replication initiation timing